MLFSEVYGTYYNVLARLLTEAVEGRLTRETMLRIVRERGFEESVLTIPEALETQAWLPGTNPHPWSTRPPCP